MQVMEIVYGMLEGIRVGQMWRWKERVWGEGLPGVSGKAGLGQS